MVAKRTILKTPLSGLRIVRRMGNCTEVARLQPGSGIFVAYLLDLSLETKNKVMEKNKKEELLNLLKENRVASAIIIIMVIIISFFVVRPLYIRKECSSKTEKYVIERRSDFYYACLHEKGIDK